MGGRRLGRIFSAVKGSGRGVYWHSTGALRGKEGVRSFFWGANRNQRRGQTAASPTGEGQMFSLTPSPTHSPPIEPPPGDSTSNATSQSACVRTQPRFGRACVQGPRRVSRAAGRVLSYSNHLSYLIRLILAQKDVGGHFFFV